MKRLLFTFNSLRHLAGVEDKLGIQTKLLSIPGGGHGATFPGAKNPPDYLGEMTRWFDTYLIQK